MVGYAFSSHIDTALTLDAPRVLCPAFSFISPLAIGAVSVLSPPFTRLSLGLRCRFGCRVPVAHSKAPTEAGAEIGANSLPTGEPHRTSRPVPGLFFYPAARD